MSVCAAIPDHAVALAAGARRRMLALWMSLAALAVTACDTAPVRSQPQAKPRPQTRWTRPAIPPSRTLGADGLPAPGDIPADLMNVPDAVPRREPRSASGNPDSYEVFGERYTVLTDFTGFKERGIASWYGTKFHGKDTSSGEPYDMFRMTAAHKTLPIPCYVRVTNLDNGKSAVVRVNDRGPFHDERVIDLSYVAALKLGIIGTGSAPVEIQALTPEAPTATPTILARRTPAAPAASPTPPVATTAPAASVAAIPAKTPAVVPATATATTARAGGLVPASSGPAIAATAPIPATLGSGTSTAQTAIPGGYTWLQAGSFINRINASALRDQLGTLGFTNVQVKQELRGSIPMHRVLIGPFASVSSRDAVRGRLAAVQMPSIPVID